MFCAGRISRVKPSPIPGFAIAECCRIIRSRHRIDEVSSGLVAKLRGDSDYVGYLVQLPWGRRSIIELGKPTERISDFPNQVIVWTCVLVARWVIVVLCPSASV